MTKQPHGPPMTLGNMRVLGVHRLIGYCPRRCAADSVGEIVRNKRIGVICLFNRGLIRSEDASSG